MRGKLSLSTSVLALICCNAAHAQTASTPTQTSASDNSGVEIFQAGTKKERDSTVTSGGRVLGVTAEGDSLRAALKLAYQAVERIHFDGMHYRKDIGANAGHVKAAGD